MILYHVTYLSVHWMYMLIMVIFNTTFWCTLIATNFKTKNFVSVLYAKYGDYSTYNIDEYNYVTTPSSLQA